MSINNTKTLVGGGNATIKKERSSNLELYRIIVMLLIVAHHYVVNSGLNKVALEDPMSVNSLYYTIFGAWGKVGINCFVLITGYFMCKSEITLRKFLKLFLWVMTYHILITGVFTAFGYHPEGLFKMWFSVIPMLNITDGFTSCFLVFYLCIPFLNILIRNLNQKQHMWLIVLMLFIYTLHGSVPKMSVNMNYVSWFSVIYFIAAYLRIYPTRRDKDTNFWGLLTLISWTLSVGSIIAFRWASSKIGMSNMSYFWVADSNAILAVTNSVTSFMWFRNLKIKNSKLINTIAASSFAVLLIHANSNTMRQWLWYDTIDCVGHYDASFYWLYAIGCVLAIYAVCTIIDIIRIKTIETPLLNASERFCINIYNKSNKKKK